MAELLSTKFHLQYCYNCLFSFHNNKKIKLIKLEKLQVSNGYNSMLQETLSVAMLNSDKNADDPDISNKILRTYTESTEIYFKNP